MTNHRLKSMESLFFVNRQNVRADVKFPDNSDGESASKVSYSEILVANVQQHMLYGYCAQSQRFEYSHHGLCTLEGKKQF